MENVLKSFGVGYYQNVLLVGTTIGVNWHLTKVEKLTPKLPLIR